MKWVFTQNYDLRKTVESDESENYL